MMKRFSGARRALLASLPLLTFVLLTAPALAKDATPEQKAALKAWTEQRAAALAAALDGEKAALIAANPEAKGLQKGQLLAKNKKAMENAAEAKAIAWEQQNPRPTPVLPAVEMDSIAERFGFTSGDELAKAMKEQPSAKDTIEGVTEQRLLEEHGELVTQKGIQQAANEAVHNEARARFVATELATLQHAMNQKAKAPGARVSTNVLVKGAKEFAQAIVARRKIMDLRPGRYTAAETRAAAAVQQAMAAGDQQAAVSAQRDRLLNLYAAKETVTAREEIKRAVEYLRKFEKDAVRTKLPPEYLDAIKKSPTPPPLPPVRPQRQRPLARLQQRHHGRQFVGTRLVQSQACRAVRADVQGKFGEELDAGDAGDCHRHRIIDCNVRMLEQAARLLKKFQCLL